MSSSEELPQAMVTLAIAEQDTLDQAATSATPPSVDIPDSPSMEVDVSPSKFTYFPNLPDKLRLKIWKHASFLPRNVDLWIGKWSVAHVNNFKLGDDHHFAHYFYLHCPPPAILHTCHESRREGLVTYRLQFDGQYWSGGSGSHRRQFIFTTLPTVYINWASDTLCIMNPDGLRGGSPNGIIKEIVRQCNSGRLQSLAFNMGGAAASGSGLYRTEFETCMKMMLECRYLKERILFVLASSESFWIDSTNSLSSFEACLSQNVKIEFKEHIQNEEKVEVLGNAGTTLEFALARSSKLPSSVNPKPTEETGIKNRETVRIRRYEMILVKASANS
jgi:hypothetical protein